MTYSHVYTRTPTAPVARPLCVFRVLFQGAPVVDPVLGEVIEHGSHWAAESRATRLAREYRTARENFLVRREWL